MSSDFKGEFLTVTRYCGPANLLNSQKSRTCYQVNDSQGKFVTLTTREAQELIIVLQAALIDWRGEL